MKHYKYKVMSYIVRIEEFKPLGLTFADKQDIAIRYFNKLESVEKYVFMEKLKGKTVQVTDMDEARLVSDLIGQSLNKVRSA